MTFDEIARGVPSYGEPDPDDRPCTGGDTGCGGNPCECRPADEEWQRLLAENAPATYRVPLSKHPARPFTIVPGLDAEEGDIP